MKLIIIILFIYVSSCSSRPDYGDGVINTVFDTIGSTVQHDMDISNTEILETFVDSLNIGQKGKNKIELIKHRVFDDTFVIVKFFIKRPDRWFLQNTYLYECNALMGLEPDISDFNNDSFNDLTFISLQAARGANEVRRLFVYDDYKIELTSIVNSEDYPSMLYNKEMDCIDAFLIHGGSSTVFARIKGDSLKEFASVHNDSHRTIYEIDEFENEKLLSKVKISPENVYVRYLNYKPLKEYKE